ncbi:MAG: hypothetical protein KZQ96_21405 [Candidatus Thiodiazotropha sp. (ex Lucinoma borealis)]|nr:hypothetical protein [Candidatus Thiodiazotropha sp. (ex Lucinoma borealis)]MCU7869648.1 hypothetical protein [Candidatus Thiodiazotropha sp. (ex Lucinoma borealis)]
MESITGTSISTPTTVASAAPDSNPKKYNSLSDRQLEEVAGSNQDRLSSNTVSYTELSVQQICQSGIEVNLDQDGYGEQHDHHGLTDDWLDFSQVSKSAIRIAMSLNKPVSA